ncbi:TPA: IS4 family transposase, partial [Acinetobacter baumannii]|uniref:IS4-like element ISAba1 family transposase n=1 Tax=Acinetobacter TaxID=469 RepID=UPI001146EE0D|nr:MULTISPECIES: IS4-like element ISAba1 family transposase [Bacteria]MCU4385985.1 IS4-like element ISAba1 family transposase [Acinetobacter radioresistens]HCW4114065.1 IS4 family transposase [Acinetobacter baumannii]
MTHLNELYLILNKSLKWNKSHLKCFSLIMLAIILKQTCNLSSASKALPIKCLPQSFYRRMQRFFAGQYFDYRQISQLIFNMFSFDQVQLTLDRTNWKWGKRNINILMLAIVYRGIAIPILWTLLNKRGNSDTKERIALIQRFIAIFGKDRIVNVFADREFIGEQWFTWLIEQDINFCIRGKKNFIVTNHLGKNHKISDLFRHLKVGQIECRKRRILVGRVKLYISALQLENGELLLVVSPQFNANAIQDYALRWEIETLFSCLKGRGFNLENTRLTDPRRVKKLIAVLAISFCWCYLTGEWQHNQKKAIKIKKHGRLSMSLFRYGLDYVQMAIQHLIGFGKKEEFKEILAILRKQNPDRIRVL